MSSGNWRQFCFGLNVLSHWEIFCTFPQAIGLIIQHSEACIKWLQILFSEHWLEKNGCCVAADIFRCNFCKNIFCALSQILQRFLVQCLVDKKIWFIQVMAWCRQAASELAERGKLNFWSTRPKTDVSYMFHTKFHSPRPLPEPVLSCDIHLRAILEELLKISILDMSLKIAAVE